MYCLDDHGGLCAAYGPCSNFTELWDLSFKIKFFGSENYAIVPLGTFSYEVHGKCLLMIEPLLEG